MTVYEARGTRRPHPRRVRSKPIKRVGGGSKGGCLVLVAALGSLSALFAFAAERMT